MSDLVLAIDQGTTSTRAILFDGKQAVRAAAHEEFTQYYPASGWVEHDPEEIWQSVISTCRTAIKKSGSAASDISAIGITNQRETVVIWDRATGKPIHNAIVWQDRRTAPLCQKLKNRDWKANSPAGRGCCWIPIFRGRRSPGCLITSKARAGALSAVSCWPARSTSFLIWRLTGGKVHATDASNASRTLVYNIQRNEWDAELLEILRIPAALLPSVKDCADDFGVTERSLFGAEIPILGVAGDQQAATIGQACFEPGMMKSTYGTGCFAILNTGSDLCRSKNRLLTTIAYRLNGKTTYALEGSIFVAGAAVQWLRDGIKVIDKAEHSGELAAKADDKQNVYLVPAFVGLGAPHWDADARGAIFGLTRNSGPAEFARAALESVAFQTRDLLDAMRKDWKGGSARTVLRVDGGMVASDWTMQRLADILDAPVDRPTVMETTALGAAWLAGSRAGTWPDAKEFAKAWALDRRFAPNMDAASRSRKLAGWRDAVRRTLTR